ncbi:hypothetical protein M885DRAFT_505649 [Pelagophyceae sp. CCMP2097]|nr:hypothetical protein M885DRAFT_505649 [Pelagophyceae sp. CCMP2097]
MLCRLPRRLLGGACHRAFGGAGAGPVSVAVTSAVTHEFEGEGHVAVRRVLDELAVQPGLSLAGVTKTPTAAAALKALRCDLGAGMRNLDTEDLKGVATFLPTSQPPRIFTHEPADGDGFPAALADEVLFACEGARLSFVCLAQGDGRSLRPLMDRLDGLFPGAYVIGAALGDTSLLSLNGDLVNPVIGDDDIAGLCAEAEGPAAGSATLIVGAALIDAPPPRALAKALALIAPLHVKLNATAARTLFLPVEPADVAEPAPESEAATGSVVLEHAFVDCPPLFMLAGVTIVPGEEVVLNIFEPRYREMLRECVEARSGFVVLRPGEAVGTLCSVLDATHEADSSRIVAFGGRRVKVDGAMSQRAEFGLLRASACEFVADEPDDALEKLAVANALIDQICEAFNVVTNEVDAVREYDTTALVVTLNSDLRADPSCEKFSWTIGRWIGHLAHPDKERWLSGFSTLDRLHSQMKLLGSFLDKAKGPPGPR